MIKLYEHWHGEKIIKYTLNPPTRAVEGEKKFLDNPSIKVCSLLGKISAWEWREKYGRC